MAKRSPVEHQERVTTGAHLSLQIGKAVAFEADITAAGLLAVGAVVCGSLIGSAIIVLAAKKNGAASVAKMLEGRG